MELDKQVVSLELAMKLKKLGVKQESIFRHTPEGDVLFNGGNLAHNIGNSISAFTVAELGELLPRTITNDEQEYIIRHTIDDYAHKGFLCRTHYGRGSNHISSGAYKNEANSRASMLIYLIENELISK